MQEHAGLKLLHAGCNFGKEELNAYVIRFGKCSFEVLQHDYGCGRMKFGVCRFVNG
jgi:hypothetical protein